MNKQYLRKIVKAEEGLQLIPKTDDPWGLKSQVTSTENAQLGATQMEAYHKALSQATQGLRNRAYLTSMLNGANSLGTDISNYGITQGNSTVAGIGSLIGNMGQLGQLAQNWSSLSSAQKLSGVSNIAGSAMDTVDTMLFTKQNNSDSALTKGLNTAYDSAASTVMKFNPMIGTAMKAGKLVGDGLTALGVGTDQQTTADKILDSNWFKLTPTGLINAGFGSQTQDFSANNETLERVGAAYGGSVKRINNAVAKAGKKYGLFSSGDRHDANSYIDEARRQQNIMTGISNEYQDQLANKSDLAYTRYNMDLNGGYQQQYVRAAKQGAVLKRIELRKHRKGGELHNVINLETKQVEWKPVISTELPIQEYKEGGTIEQEWQPTITIVQEYKEGGKTEETKEEFKVDTNQKNVIPEGALHARKHHMEHDSDITKKGIPVVDNKGEQQAEVEVNEIIFSLEVTKKLEELHDIYRKEESTQKEKDEAARQAGEFLVYQILHNTLDKTGLIKECKKGGVLDGNR